MSRDERLTGRPETFSAARARIAQALRDAGVGLPGTEVNRMIAHVTGLSVIAEIASDRDTLTPEEVAALDAMLARRLAKEPLQHILGWTWFYGLEIRCDARALIPRPDSECVVDAALGRLPKGAPLRLADLGTGTGCLLAALLSERPEARGTGVEASPEAASLARENFTALGLAARADVFEGSWTGWQGWPVADLIISNPPYIASAVIPELEPEVRRYDPAAALDGGPDGLAAYREIIPLAGAGLRPGAWLVLEIGYDQASAARSLMALSGFENIESGKDLGGNDRWVAGQAGH
ncbi:MAG: peptide chain release factor N(5)-glutamine methyltransferase [Hyphomonas sp.]